MAVNTSLQHSEFKTKRALLSLGSCSSGKQSTMIGPAERRRAGSLEGAGGVSSDLSEMIEDCGHPTLPPKKEQFRINQVSKGSLSYVMCVGVLSACMSVNHMLAWCCGGQKRVSFPQSPCKKLSRKTCFCNPSTGQVQTRIPGAS